MLSLYRSLGSASNSLPCRRCCNITFLVICNSRNMITCNQEWPCLESVTCSLWEMNIYCPKLQVLVIQGR